MPPALRAVQDDLTEGAAAARSCPGCGLRLPLDARLPAHPYIGASPECFALYGELLAREYGPLGYPPAHRLAVDAYAAQHPGKPGRRSVQSVAVHLVGLCLALEHGVEPQAVARILAGAPARLAGSARWLELPTPIGRVTVRDVLEARDHAEHAARVEEWARDVWRSWRPHHEVVRAWLEEALAGRGARSR